jgi:hypothetical protein
LTQIEQYCLNHFKTNSGPYVSKAASRHLQESKPFNRLQQGLFHCLPPIHRLARLR